MKDHRRTVIDRSRPVALLAVAVFAALSASHASAQEVSVVSATSFARGSPLPPDSIASAFVADLAAATEAAVETPLPTVLAGTRVAVVESEQTSHVAPLFLVSPGQINFLIPSAAALGPATV